MHLARIDSASVLNAGRYDLAVRSTLFVRYCLIVLVLIVGSPRGIIAAEIDGEPEASRRDLQTTVANLVGEVRARATTLEASSGMRHSFQSFTSAYKIAPGSISYSDFVIVRLLYEATRDAGFWNMHWTITNMPPNSDRVWSQ
jgi:hypothetical protein